jgi:YVTN family beta-propeller protein
LTIPVILKAQDSTLFLKKIIRGGLSPKSVVHSGAGLFFAQNMMYRHTITVYNRDYELIKTINDKIKPKDFGIDTIEGSLTGSPVETAFSHDGKYAWVSNYNMSGNKFINPGCDECYAKTYDDSYLYKINTESLEVEKIIPVGSVPKYVAVSPDNKYVLVSNWSSGDVSIVDVEKSKEIKRINAGRFPRGIVVDSKSKYAYVTVMGSIHVMKIDLVDFTTSWIKNVGGGPRHLCITSNDSTLYVSLNTEGKIAKINLHDGSIEKLACGGSPRSMVMTPDDKFIYVVYRYRTTCNQGESDRNYF